MLSENDKQNLFRNLTRNRVALVVGAGFSKEATNIAGQNLPLAGELASLLWSFLYGTPYDSKTSLKSIYGAALVHPTGKAALRAFLDQQLRIKGFPSWYTPLTQYYWRRIYGFNADNLIETIYSDAGVPQLDTLVAPAEYRERDAFLRTIQYVKLHGSIDDPRDLTFGPREYGARAAARADLWYLHFVEDYSTTMTLFVGTQLDEPLFWQYVELRGTQVSRGLKVRRPKCFLVTPNISKPDEEILEQYNIFCVPATAQDFLTWLHSELPPLTREDTLRLVDPTLEPGLLASEHGATAADAARIEYFYSYFRVPVRPANPRSRPMFLLGNPPTWEDIAADLDAHREVSDTLLSRLVNAIKTGDAEVILLSSAAGGGKSTLCKRAALELVDLGFSVFFSEGGTSPDPDKLAAQVATLNQKCFLFFDNAGNDLTLISGLFERIKDVGTKPILVVAARSNDIAFHGDEFEKAGARVEQIGIPDLCDADIEAILEILRVHDLLGNLREKSHQEQVHIFRSKARKQILVAMREATSGRGFDEIIQDEYKAVKPEQAKLLYLIAALASDEDYGLTVQQMLTAMDLPPVETQLLIEKSLAGILVQHEYDSGTYFIRHPAIAHFIIDSAPRAPLADAVVALLISISTVLPTGRERRFSRAFRIYRNILSHRRLSDLFAGKLFLVRRIYEDIKDYFREDGHYWLQYGSFETEHEGDISLADNYLAQAAALLPPNNRQVETATAHLLFRKALAAANADPAAQYADEALRILRGHMADRNNVSPHALHIFGSQMLNYVWRWTNTTDRARSFREVHDELRTAIPDHLRRNLELARVLTALKRAELETAVKS